MPINLKYKHQAKTYELMLKELNEYGQVAYSFPTGAGKTFPSLKYLEDNPEENALIVVPTRVIKKQWEKYIKDGIADGEKRIKDKKIEVITYSKLSLLMKKIKNLNVDVFILDEAQSMGAETYEPAIDEFRRQHPNVKEIGMTATPERMDGRNMLYEKYGEHVVYEMSLTDALSGEKEGEVILNAPRYVRVLSQLKPIIDEYKDRIERESDTEKRERLIEKYKRLSTIVANSPDIEEIMQLGMKKKNGKYIVFCKDREDLQEKMQEAERIFGKVNKNIKKYYILSKGEGELGKTNAQNDGELERFENAEYGEELQLLFCVDMLNLGKHINSENIDGEVMFRETSSKIVYKQQIGRVMVAGDESDKKVIIDVANNWLRQIDTFKEFEGAISLGQAKSTGNKLDDFMLQGEELEFLTLLREIGEECHFNYYNTYEQLIEWLETHNGKMPTHKFGGRENDVNQLTEDERYQKNLYARWIQSAPEKKILDEYIGKSIEDVPKEYKDKIARLRSFGLGLTIYEQIIEWLETHDGEMPKSCEKKVEEMSEEEQYRKNLYQRWNRTLEKKILDEYADRPIEEVPEEYKEKISRLRSLIAKKKSTYDQLIEWLDTHNGEMPKNIGGKASKDMSEEDQYGRRLYAKWQYAPEKKIFDKFSGLPIEEIPEEYRTKISKLRNLIANRESTYDQLIEWLEKHNGKMPKGMTKKSVNEMNEEEQYERNLYSRWLISPEWKIFKEFANKPIEEVPEEYRDKISRLRSLISKKESTYDKLIEWLEKHNGNMPKGMTRKRINELSIKEKNERNLYHNWLNTSEKKILDEYAGRPIEEVPEEYRDKIAQLREFGLGLKASKIQKAKQKRDDARTKNDQTKELEQQVSEQLEKRGQSHDEQ